MIDLAMCRCRLEGLARPTGTLGSVGRTLELSKMVLLIGLARHRAGSKVVAVRAKCAPWRRFLDRGQSRIMRLSYLPQDPCRPRRAAARGPQNYFYLYKAVPLSSPPGPPMALPEPKGKESWIALAQLRITRVLQRRVAATIRQLEVKICESGPPKKRPQPHILDTAIERMVKGDQLIPMKPPRLKADEQETTFLTLPPYYPEPATQRMRELLVYYRLYRTWAETQEYCGDVLERVVENTFVAAGAQYQHLGRLPMGMPDVGELDGVWELNGQRIGVEAKNWRAWIYPSSPAIWKMIRKCLVVDAVPFLVAREVAYITGVLCSKMGRPSRRTAKSSIHWFPHISWPTSDTLTSSATRTC